MRRSRLCFSQMPDDAVNPAEAYLCLDRSVFPEALLAMAESAANRRLFGSLRRSQEFLVPCTMVTMGARPHSSHPGLQMQAG